MTKQHKYSALKLQTAARIIVYSSFILLGLLLVAGIWVIVFHPDWGGPALPAQGPHPCTRTGYATHPASCETPLHYVPSR